VSACAPSLKPVINRSFGADYVAVLKNGRIYAHDPSNIAVISGDNQLLEDASFQWDGDNWLSASENIVMRLKGLTKPLKVKGKVCSLLSIGSVKHYYYFWVNELLPKIHLLKESGEFDKIDYFLIPQRQFRYQREYLDHFGIGKNRIIDEEFHPHVQADELVITSYVGKLAHYPKWAFQFVQRSLCKPDQRSQRKAIYISRKDASINRPVLNEDGVIELLKAYGVDILVLTSLSIWEQAQKFHGASIVVAAHGAGLTNLVYCQPGTKVLELFPSNYVRHGYYDISNKMELEYHYMLCEPDRPSLHHSEGQRVGLTVDLEAFREKLEEIFK
jgi:capsular polysaccharide biosynthesis protein